MGEITPIEWVDGKVRILDQSKLPGEIVYLDCRSPEQVAEAIQKMRIRGAPALGIAAAFALALCASNSRQKESKGLLEELEACADSIRATRPTARNLFWAIERMLELARESGEVAVGELRSALIQEANTILKEDRQTCRQIGDLGAELVPQKATILTHCNAGALATGGYGTALGVIRSAVRQGKKVSVLADETRPLLQGARLTAWELSQEGIPVTVITDSMAGTCMQQGKVNLVVVGADRIAGNGDVANKVGTYPLAVLAKEHGVPFYVAAPVSTMDLSLASGDQIPIEERSETEVTEIAGTRIAPLGVSVLNPAFDVTPARLVTAIICEKGILRPPYQDSLETAQEC